MDTTRLDRELFYRGAEANLTLSTFPPWKAVIKQRIRKQYRHSQLDSEIRRERTISEASLIHEAKKAGLKVPSIISVDPETNTIVMTHIPGTVLRECLDSMSRTDATRLFRSIGRHVGLLHDAGIVHGDLTTSNIIITPEGDPFIVDFGMSRRTLEPEDRGVDLHLLQRSIAASHLQEISSLVKALGQGYRETAGEKTATSSWAKAREISRRGRYYAIR